MAGAILLTVSFHPAVAQLSWASVDVGAVAAAGSSSETNGGMVVNGSGADIWEYADEFHFRYVPWNGDGVFVVRVTSLTNTHPWAKAGIMIRPSLSPNAPHVFANVNPNQVASRIYRNNPGDASLIDARLSDVDRFMPMWLKLTREGGVIAAHFSRDGITWALLGQGTFAFPANVLVGLAVSSHADGTMATGTFDNLRLAGNAPGYLTAVAHSPQRVDLAWTYTTPTATSHQVERSTDNRAFTVVGTTAANVWSYSDLTASPATTYYYRIRALTPSGPSGYTNVASALTPPAPPAGWLAADVGATAVTGRTIQAGNTFTLEGSGRGVGGVDLVHIATGRGDLDYVVAGYSDEFHFAYQSWSGNGEIVARLTGVSPPPGAQAGIMVRSSTDPSALSVCYHVRAGGLGVAVLARPGTNSDPRFRNESVYHYETPTGPPPPTWLKLVRDGLGVMSYASSDGINWTELVWVRSVLQGDVLMGLAVSSRQNGNPVTGALPAVTTATFDNVRVGAVTTPLAPPPAPTALMATDILTDRISLAWQNATTAYDAAEVERSTDGSTFVRVTFANFQGTSYNDLSLMPGTTYYYRVRLTRGSQVSAYSNTLTARTLDVPAPPSNLTARANLATQVELTWVDNSTSEAFFQVWRSTDGVEFVVRAATQANATSFLDPSVSPATTYYYRVRAISGGGDSAFSNTASVTTPAGTWQSRDVGKVAAAGSYSESGTLVTLSGSGADIWGTADAFHYAFQPWSGNGEIRADVRTLTPTNPWAKVGVMFRETLLPGSRHVFLAVTPEHGIALQSRLTDGGESKHQATTGSGALPTWIRLVRSGSTFTAYQTNDLSHWELIGTETLALPPDVYVGVAITSHHDGVLATATFSQVQVISMLPPPTDTLPPPTGLTAVAAVPNQVTLTWTDNSSDETAFTVERSPDNQTYQLVGVVAPDTVTFSDTTVSPGTTYYYLVRARRGDYVSGYSNVAAVSTPATPPPTDWESRDIGLVALAGAVSESGGVVQLTGSGEDIWSNADSFRFHARSLVGDAEFVARVSSLTPTDSWAKAGLMFRESTEPGSRHVFLALTPGNGVVLQGREVTNGSSFSMSGAWVQAPRWLKLTRSGSTFTGYESLDGTVWYHVGGVTLDLPATLLAGLAVTSHNQSARATGVFDHIAITGGAVPGNWALADIGEVGLSGSNEALGNTLTVRGSGADIWGHADAFRFVYRQISGDGVVEAQVVSLTNTNPWAKAGVMIRESTAPDARNVFAYLTPQNGSGAQVRSAPGVATTYNAGPWVTAPWWLRLVRSGPRVVAYASSDGAAWTQFAAYDVTFGATALLGFAVTAHDTTQLNTAVFADPYVQ